MFVLLVWIGCAVACNAMAKSKGRNSVAWTVAGLIFGVFAVVVIALLPKTSNSPSTSQPAGISWSQNGLSLTAPPQVGPTVGDVGAQLRDLNQLLQDGLITQSEFDSKRQALLDQM